MLELQVVHHRLDRWENGKGYHKGTAIRSAIDKYGWHNLLHHIVATDLSKQHAIELEKFYISLLKSNQKEYGYNLTIGGEGGHTSSFIAIKQKCH